MLSDCGTNTRKLFVESPGTGKEYLASITSHGVPIPSITLPLGVVAGEVHRISVVRAAPAHPHGIVWLRIATGGNYPGVAAATQWRAFVDGSEADLRLAKYPESAPVFALE